MSDDDDRRELYEILQRRPDLLLELLAANTEARAASVKEYGDPFKRSKTGVGTGMFADPPARRIARRFYQSQAGRDFAHDHEWNRAAFVKALRQQPWITKWGVLLKKDTNTWAGAVITETEQADIDKVIREASTVNKYALPMGGRPPASLHDNVRRQERARRGAG